MNRRFTKDDENRRDKAVLALSEAKNVPPIDLKPNKLGNYTSLSGNYATGVVARFIGLKRDFRMNIEIISKGEQ